MKIEFASPKEEIGLIQGQTPDSKEEWWVAKALWKLEVPFLYQFEVFGGTSRRGGLVVDFVVWIPMIAPVMVQGEYWHSADETLIISAITQYFHREPIMLWVKYLVDEEATYRATEKALYG